MPPALALALPLALAVPTAGAATASEAAAADGSARAAAGATTASAGTAAAAEDALAPHAADTPAGGWTSSGTPKAAAARMTADIEGRLQVSVAKASAKVAANISKKAGGEGVVFRIRARLLPNRVARHCTVMAQGPRPSSCRTASLPAGRW